MISGTKSTSRIGRLCIQSLQGHVSQVPKTEIRGWTYIHENSRQLFRHFSNCAAEKEAADLAEASWGAVGPWRRLPGEQINLMSRCGLLKIYTKTPNHVLELEEAIITRLAQCGIPVPTINPTIDNAKAVECSISGQSTSARMFKSCLAEHCMTPEQSR